MRITHIITGLSEGGAEALLYRLCLNESRHQHRVISLCTEGKYSALLLDAGVDVTSLDMPRGQVTFRGLRLLFILLRNHKPDVVQTWLPHADLIGGVVARLAGIKSVVWGIYHTSLDSAKAKRATIAVSWLCAKLSRFVPRYIIVCAESAKVAHADIGFAIDRMIVVPSGFDLALFRPDPERGMAVRHLIGIADVMPAIGFVARFDPAKDHPTLLRAIALAKSQFVCILIGRGLDCPAIRNLIGELNLEGRVKILGARSDIPHVMNALDIHVMSSVTEAFPNVLAEAMACGIPCITTDVGDTAIIVGESGWVVPAEDPQKLAEAIDAAIDAMNNHDQWQQRKSQARQHIESNFSLDRMLSEYERVWIAAAR